MTKAAFFAVPGDLSAPTGGYEYARQVLAALPGLSLLPLPGAWSQAELTLAAERLAAVPHDAVLLIDGLALGALPPWCLDRIKAPVVGLIHHPLFLETGLSETQQAALFTSERAALARTERVIATSPSTAASLTEVFGVPPQRIIVAEPGTEPAPRAIGGGNPPHVLAVGSVVPRKGYALLVEALADLAALPWRLTIAGALDRDRATVAQVQAAITAQRLADRVVLAGAVDRAGMDALYASADVFVMASFHEGYGMAAAEAMARGLPMVVSDGGALAATVPDAAGLRFAAGDVAGLRSALGRMLGDPKVRTTYAAGSWAAGSRLPRWADTAERIARVLGI
jgi:glycosyltransferase involved in cell wall biosynthesis